MEPEINAWLGIISICESIRTSQDPGVLPTVISQWVSQSLFISREATRPPISMTNGYTQIPNISAGTIFQNPRSLPHILIISKHFAWLASSPLEQWQTREPLDAAGTWHADVFFWTPPFKPIYNAIKDPILLRKFIQSAMKFSNFYNVSYYRLPTHSNYITFGEDTTGEPPITWI